MSREPYPLVKFGGGGMMSWAVLQGLGPLVPVKGDVRLHSHDGVEKNVIPHLTAVHGRQ